MKSLIFLTLAILVSQNAQSLDKEDLAFGSLKIGATLDNIEKEYGLPLGYKFSPNQQTTFRPYYLFPSFKVYVANNNPDRVPDKDSKIETIEILDSSIHTNKGIKIGDDIKKIKMIYPDTYLSDYFESNGNHDNFYTDYSQVAVYEVSGPDEDVVGGIGTIEVLVFYFRSDLLVKIVSEKVFP